MRIAVALLLGYVSAAQLNQHDSNDFKKYMQASQSLLQKSSGYKF